MSYSVFISDRALRFINDQDKAVKKRIMSWISENLVGCDNPYVHGHPLKGDLGEFWSYRVGDYRLISSISDQELRIDIIEAGHRSKVYQRRAPSWSIYSSIGPPASPLRSPAEKSGP